MARHVPERPGIKVAIPPINGGFRLPAAISLPQSPFPPIALGFFGLGTGYLIYGPRELLGLIYLMFAVVLDLSLKYTLYF